MNDLGTIKRVGARLRALRVHQNLSLRDVSGKIGISISHLSQIERGQSHTSITVLTKLARLYEVGLDGLIEPDWESCNPVLYIGGGDPAVLAFYQALQDEAIPFRKRVALQALVREAIALAREAS